MTDVYEKLAKHLDSLPAGYPQHGIGCGDADPQSASSRPKRPNSPQR
jgi:hypothetical protein